MARDADLRGVDQLGGDDSAVSAEVITPEQLVERTRRALDTGSGPLVDVRHRSARDATVIAIHERYVP